MSTYKAIFLDIREADKLSDMPELVEIMQAYTHEYITYGEYKELRDLYQSKWSALASYD